MFYEYSQNYLPPFYSFAPYPTLSDRAFWDTLPAFDRQKLSAMGEEYLTFEYPYLKATDFMAFKRTGNRSFFENKMFSKRKALDALVLAECVENSGRFLDQIIDGIFAICDEAAWQLPAHNTYVRDTPQLLLPDTTDPVIELFACESGAVLAATYYLLKDKLDEISPFICKRIKAELQKRVLYPYLHRHFWWMGRGREPMCNWTIWCTQNVLLTAFLLEWPASMQLKIFRKACKSVDYFLKDYGQDGCCDEGAQYYRHAGLCLFQTLDILCKITNDHFAPLWKNEKVRNIASYILNVHVDDKYYVNFADCSPVAGRAGVREYLFGKQTENPSLMQFAASDYSISESQFSPQENNLYYRLQEVFHRQEILSQKVPAHISHPPVFYESVGIFIARNTAYTLAVKAGDNDDSHNHNDTGSITLYKNGQPLLIDVGVETYTQKTFSPERYSIWTMQSDYHNLPTINGCMQKDGSAYKAKILSHQFTKEGGEISLDIAGAYETTAGINEYVRTVGLNEAGVALMDQWCFSSARYQKESAEQHLHKESAKNEVILNFMTYEKPELSENKLMIGDLGVLELLKDSFTNLDTSNILIEEIPITDDRLKTCWDHEIYRIRILLKSEHEFSCHIY